MAAHVDLDGVLALAAGAPDLTGAPWDPAAALAAAGFVAGPASGADRTVVAVAGGRAFTFAYPETAELLRAAGCQVVVLDPLTDTALPEGTGGLYLGGGFPQVYAAELAGNAALRQAVRRAVAAGLPVAAECAGLLYLADTLERMPMAGVIPAAASMTPRLTMGYREAVAPADTLLAAAGDAVRGHEFHRTAFERAAAEPAWRIGAAGEGWSLDPAGTGAPTVHASYLHAHWAGFPAMAGRFARAVHRYAPAPADLAPRADGVPTAHAPGDTVDLCHHGDVDLVPGAVDLAVNVRGEASGWLRAVVTGDDGGDSAAYPNDRGGGSHRHPARPRPRDGAADRGRGGGVHADRAGRGAAYPVVVHPQFTEPEAALRAAGRTPARDLLRADRGFTRRPRRSPTGPTWSSSATRPTPPACCTRRRCCARWRDRGRVVVVDEAFMDLVPGEPETLIGPRHARAAR